MFQMKKKTAMSGLATLAVAGLTIGVSASAFADPAIPGPLPYRTLVAAGSDTIQDVSNGFAAAALDSYGYPSVLGSYDATGTAQIQTRSGGQSFVRPNGSTNGLRALRASMDPDNYLWNGVEVGGQVDIARSSSAPPQTTPAEVSYIPFAVDAVTWAHSPSFPIGSIPLGTSVGQDTDGDGIRDLTLMNIFGYDSGSTATITLESTGVPVTTKTVGIQGSGAQIIPFIPQAGSGTRSFWQGKVGGTFSLLTSDTFTDGTGTGTNDVQEHDGSVTAEIPNAVVPFSIAQYIAQGNSIEGVTDRRHGAVLGSINSVAPVTGGVLNTSFPIKRNVYFVASTERLTSEPSNPDDAALVKFLLGTGSGDSPWVCDMTDTITEYGFGLMSTGCGVVEGYRSLASLG